VLYPGAEVQRIADSSAAFRKPFVAFLLGTNDTIQNVVRYYEREFTPFGQVHIERLYRRKVAQSVELSLGAGKAIVMVFKGSRNTRDVWQLETADYGEETKILINMTAPERARPAEALARQLRIDLRGK
jgi:hypothetical protein